jgi:tetratricopeptide (TPR) repeat protein
MARAKVGGRFGAVWTHGALAVLVVVSVQVGRAADDSLVGTRVIARAREATLMVGSTVVARGDIHRVYRVERAEGPWLWVVADGGGVRGWVRATEVIPFDQAVEHFTSEIRNHPDSAWAYQMRGLIHYDRREYDQAIADGDMAIKLDPRDAVAYYNRGNAFYAKREYAQAIADYNEVMRLNPRDVTAYVNRARAWSALNEHNLAVADLNEAIRLEPNEPAHYHARARALLALGQYAHALEDYDRILQKTPDDAAALLGRAWIWATCSDEKLRSGPRAITDATRACILTNWQDPYELGTLAAAYAEAGDYLNAVAWQTRALERFAPDDSRLEDHRRRLAFYKEHKPWRESQAAPR